MGLLFRLPFLLLELLVRRLLRRDHDDEVFAAAPAPAPTPERTAPPAAPSHDGPPPPTAEEALARSAARQAGRTPPPPAPPAPNLRAVGDDGHVDTEATLVESFGSPDDLGTSAGFTVDEPWDGYDGMPATAVVRRVRGSDEATKAVVRLYEQQHKARATVLRATG
ncbi:MAG TPA: hypothetical protein VGM33_23520 [Baekduia sp.]|jgi:hypothetical protein